MPFLGASRRADTVSFRSGPLTRLDELRDAHFVLQVEEMRFGLRNIDFGTNIPLSE